MLRSFRDRATARLFHREPVRQWGPALQRAARRKLLLLDAAPSLDALGRVPGNRLEKLSGDRAGQWSIRINDQWRLCFRWAADGVHEVEITDYH